MVRRFTTREESNRPHTATKYWVRIDDIEACERHLAPFLKKMTVQLAQPDQALVCDVIHHEQSIEWLKVQLRKNDLFALQWCLDKEHLKCHMWRKIDGRCTKDTESVLKSTRQMLLDVSVTRMLYNRDQITPHEVRDAPSTNAGEDSTKSSARKKCQPSRPSGEQPRRATSLDIGRSTGSQGTKQTTSEMLAQQERELMASLDSLDQVATAQYIEDDPTWFPMKYNLSLIHI